MAEPETHRREVFCIEAGQPSVQLAANFMEEIKGVYVRDHLDPQVFIDWAR